MGVARMREAAVSAGAILLLLPGLAAAGDDLRLVEAVRDRDEQAVAALLKQNVDVDGSQPDGATALHWAAHWNDLSITDLLIRAGAEINVANRYGATPLWLAGVNGSAPVVARLLEAGADPNLALVSGETPLMAAARSGNVDAVRALLNSGAAVGATETAHGQTALMWAIAEEHLSVVDALITHGADVRRGSTRGFTPLMFAARGGDVALGRFLVAQGAEVNTTVADGSTPLLVAAVRGHVPFAKFLLAQGADPNAAATGYTALHWASGIWESNTTQEYTFTTGEWTAWAGVPTREGKLELIKALIAHGADVNGRMTRSAPRYGFSLFAFTWKGKSLRGATPFFLAALSGDVEVMRALVSLGAHPLAGTADQTTPLMVAAGRARTNAETSIPEENALAATRLTLDLGNDVHAVNDAGETALHAAAGAGLDTVTEYLVASGVDLDAETNEGRTALALAEGTEVAMQIVTRPSTAALLRQLGARAPE